MADRVASVRQNLLRLGGPPGGAATDRQLLECFARTRDEAAFAALLHRHGAMVRGVCRRVLGPTADADDAFQATFLVLVRRAASAGWHESVGGWLHAVASRVAHKVRAGAARAAARARRAAPREEPAVPDPDPPTAAALRELSAVLDEELARLPEKYRLPLVLCYLEGRTNEEAALHLGWTKGTVSGRLARARDILRGRLARRDLAVSVAALEVALTHAASAAPPPAALFDSTLKAAALAAAGSAAGAGGASATAVALAEGVTKAMSLTRLKIATAVLLGLGALGAGATLVAYHAPAGQNAAPEPRPRPADKPTPKPADKPMTDEEKLQGTWHLVAGEFESKPLTRDELEQIPEKLVIDKGEFREHRGDFPVTANLKLDPAKTLKSFDLVTRTSVIDGGVKRVTEEVTGKGIYRLDGDTLTIAREGQDEARPTGFKTTADTPFVVHVYKRGEPPAKPEGPKQPEFVEAEVTLYLGVDGLPGEPGQKQTKTVKDKATLAKFASCFPEAGRGKKVDIAGGWIARMSFKFTGSKGEVVTVSSTWTMWSEGKGDWLVKANLMKYAGELFEVPRLIDQGDLMDDWELVTFEEGGKKRDVKGVGIAVTDYDFELQVGEKAEWEAKYALDPGKKPKEIALVFEAGTKDEKTWRGIYAVEGDALKICLDKDGKKRPTEFKTTVGNANEVLLVLRRKPEAPAR